MAEHSEDRDKTTVDGVRFMVTLPGGRQVEVGYMEGRPGRQADASPLACPACGSTLAQPLWKHACRRGKTIVLPLRCPECDGLCEVSLDGTGMSTLMAEHRRGLAQIAADLQLVAGANERQARREIAALADALADGELDPSDFES